MGAKLVVVAGSQAGQEFWIEDEVARVGSDPICQICLSDSGLPGHALTLEFRDGGYVVYNKSDQPIHVDQKMVGVRSLGRWPADKDLVYSNDLALRLVVEGDPTPVKQGARRAAAIDVVEASEAGEPQAGPAAPSAEEIAKKSKKNMQIAVILGAAVVVGAVLLIPDDKTEQTPTRPVAQEFDELIRQLRSTKTGNANDNDLLRTTLQSARMAELRGESQTARKYYGQIHDFFLKEREKTKLTPEQQQVWEFAKSRMEKIGVPTD